MTSNTFTTPQSSKSINLARIDINNSLQSLLSNFYGPSRPASNNITILGISTSPPDGTLWRSSKNGVLYVKDSANNKGGGGSFTVNGIGSRIIETLNNYFGNESDFELGELIKTVGSNARVYMKSANTTGDSSIKDIGIPPETYGITRQMLGNAIIDGTAVTSNVSVLERPEIYTGAKQFANNNIILSNVDSGSGIGPYLDLYRNSSSASADDMLGGILFKGKSDTSSNVEYANIYATIIDSSDSAEDGRLSISVIRSGSLTEMVRVNIDNVIVYGNTFTAANVHSLNDFYSANSLITNRIYSNYSANIGNCNVTYALSIPVLQFMANADGVSIGGSLESTAIFDINSTSKGMLLPRMTTTQRDAISSPANGLMIYNTTINSMQVYCGSEWISLITNISVTDTSTQVNISSSLNTDSLSISVSDESGGGKCFLSTAKITMANNTVKNIADIKPGDFIKGRWQTNKVIGIFKTTLGKRKLAKLNNEVFTTPDHLVWTENGFAILDKEFYSKYGTNINQNIEIDNNLIVQYKYHGILPKLVSVLNKNTKIGHISGFKLLSEIEYFQENEKLPLYSLLLDGDHLMYVDGYCFDGYAEHDYNYLEKIGK